MALAQRLDLRQSQSLVMTPQLQQAIKLLQLSNIELGEYVERELEQNPLLERDDGDDGPPQQGLGIDGDPGEAAAPPAERQDLTELTSTGTMPGEDPLDADRANLYDSNAAIDDAGDGGRWAEGRGGRSDFAEEDGSFEDTLTRAESLRDHLAAQLAVDIADPVDRLIAGVLVDQVEDSGWFLGDIAAIAAGLGCAPARVEAVLARLQGFDPPGVFARSLKECLEIQLRDRDRLDPAMQALLDHLPLLAARDMAGLRRICGVDAEDLAGMIGEIRALNPKPGESFSTEPSPAVTPDVLMRALPDGSFLVELNAETLPRVLVNRRYYAQVSRATRSKQDKDYLVERFQSANWLVKSLHQRATTILKVASEIVRQQEGFFHYGIEYLRPLVLRDIAEAIGMHESTVSRVTANKYMASPRGLFELKYFFTASIPAAGGGMAHSAEAVRFRIKALIDGEPADEVLSDDRIVEILKDQGVDIARRTVAKYRESLRIPSSVQRRREKTLGI